MASSSSGSAYPVQFHADDSSRVRPYADVDYDELFEIESEAFGKPWSRWNLNNALYGKDARVLVLEENVGSTDSWISGYVSWQCFHVKELGQRVIEITSIAVRRDFWRQGTGRRLMQTATDWAAKEYPDALCIQLHVRTDNVAAIRLYDRCGFDHVALSVKYYDDCDAFVMEYPIAPLDPPDPGSLRMLREMGYADEAASHALARSGGNVETAVAFLSGELPVLNETWDNQWWSSWWDDGWSADWRGSWDNGWGHNGVHDAHGANGCAHQNGGTVANGWSSAGAAWDARQHLEANGSEKQSRVDKTDSLAGRSFHDWFLEVDPSGGVMLYCSALEEGYDSPAQLISLYTKSGAEGLYVDPHLYEDLGLVDAEHRQLFDAWFSRHFHSGGSPNGTVPPVACTKGLHAEERGAGSKLANGCAKQCVAEESDEDEYSVAD